MTYASLAVFLKIDLYCNKYYDILSCEEPKYISFFFLFYMLILWAGLGQDLLGRRDYKFC